MVEENRNYHGKYLLTLVFASLFLVSLGMIPHSVFADSVTTTIPVSGAYGVGVNSNTNLIYVATNQGFTIQSIDGSTNTVTATIATVNNPIYTGGDCSTAYVAVNPITNMIYADNGGCLYNMGRSFVSDNISVINGTTNSIISTVDFGGGAIPSLPLAVNDMTDKIYACTPLQGENVIVIDGKTNQVTSRVSISGNEPDCTDIAINSQTNKIYVLDGFEESIHVINGTTDTVIDSIALGTSNTFVGIGVNPDTNKIYVSNGDGSLTVIDGSTDNVLTTLQTNVHGFIAVNPTTDKIYVGAIRGNSVVVIDGNTDTIMTTVQVENAPFGIGVNSNTDKIYVDNSGSSTVSVIDGNFNPTIPSAPQNLQATATSSSQINLSWNTSSDNGGSPIIGYMIERSNDTGATWSTIQSNTGSADTTYSDTGLAHSTTYTYRVSAINQVGTSQPSSTASATTFNVVPSPPTGLTATAQLLKINLSWNVPSDNGGTPITGYMIERSTDGGNTWNTIVANTGSTGTTYSDTNVLPLTTYTYRVSAINDIGTGNPSNTASAATPSVGPITPPSLP